MQNYQNNKYNEFYIPSKTEVNKNQFYKEEPFSQSFDVEAERRNRQQQRQRDYENPQNSDPDTDYYYKQSKTSSDVNDYNNRYTYNYRRDFDIIDFNKLYPENHFDQNNNLMRNNISKALDININKVSIKAKTNENCDSVGKGDAISAMAIALILGK